jgi:N-methylhydantoinase A
MVDVHSIGAGGGSIARVRQGTLLVGPESAGSVPGPVCFSRGGTRPTVTDSDAALGYLPAKGFAGGTMVLDVEAGRAAIERDIATPLGLDVDDAAWAIQRIVNAHMAQAVRRVLSQHGADPRTLSLVAYGGGGPVHAWAQARELGIGRVLVPKTSPAFSALGLLVSDYVIDLMRAYVVKLSDIDVARVRALTTELGRQAEAELAPARLGPGATQADFFAQMCYDGQNFDMPVPLPEGESLSEDNLLQLAERFHHQHETVRGFAFPNQQPLLRGLRLVLRGATPKPPALAHMGRLVRAADARTGSRPVHFGTGFVDAPTYDGTALGVGAVVEGPALIDEFFTVVVLAPTDVATLDEHGNYDITIGPA